MSHIHTCSYRQTQRSCLPGGSLNYGLIDHKLHNNLIFHPPLDEICQRWQWSVMCRRWGCNEIWCVTLRHLCPAARWWWEWCVRREDGRGGVRVSFSLSIALCACRHLLLCQQGLNQVSQQWVEWRYIYVCKPICVCMIKWRDLAPCSVVVNKF